MKRNRITEAVRQFLAAQKENPEGMHYAPFPPASDRKAWSAVDAKLSKELLLQAEQALLREMPLLTASLYLDFSRTGARKRFEDAYFGRRIRLNMLVLAECIERKGRFMDAIVDSVLAVCEESGWALPAHNSYERDKPQLALPDSTRPVMDLFACETGAQLAFIHYLLQEDLDAVSPVITKRIRAELEKRIFTPYLSYKFWWMGYNRQPTNNWTVWCTQNVLLAACMPHIFAEKTALQVSHVQTKIFVRAAYSIDRFLSDYGEDGCCDEGAQYYRHAGLCLCNALEVIRSIGGEPCARVFDDRQICNIAEYLVNVHVSGAYYLNFADCAAVAGYAGIREYLFGKACKSARLMAFAASGWKARHSADCIHNYASSDDSLNLFYFLQELFTSSEALSFADGASGAETSESSRRNLEPPRDYAYPSVGLYISRDSSFCLGAKAGCNADSHNHNDTGSFILYKHGFPFIIDVGVETYSKKTFSARRYEIWTMQSLYHNVTNFDGTMQQDGKRFKATNVRYEPAADCTSLSMHLEKAYPAESRVQRYKRVIVHRKEYDVTVTDSVAGSFSTAFFTLMTQEKPELCIAEKADSADDADGCAGHKKLYALTVAVGSVGTITLQSPSPLLADSVQIEAISVTDARLRQNWPETLYRLRVSYTASITATFA